MARRLTVALRKPNGENALSDTAGLLAPEGAGKRLRPEELGKLATRLMAASSPTHAARIKERLTRGFYGA